MLSREDSPWKTRQVVTAGALMWQAHDLAMNLIVFCHYRLKRRETTIQPVTYRALADTLRYTKGVAVFWDRWLQATHPRTSVPAVPQPSDPTEQTNSAGHAERASLVEHVDRG